MKKLQNYNIMNNNIEENFTEDNLDNFVNHFVK